MLRYSISVLLFYSLVFVFVKAQEVNVTSRSYYETDIFNNASTGFNLGFSIFLFLLFALSVVSFIVFWKYKDYLIAALNGQLQKEETERMLPAEEIGANDAKVVSQVTVHDIENNAKDDPNPTTEQRENVSRSRSFSSSETGKDNTQRTEARYAKPQIRVTIKNGQPKLVIS